ncbi:MAG: ABC transporter ATP-binding protein [Geminicoccaceae bacterium]|nr:ABC transporter ATP-binding protein [Geminicoccaceae bacterium]
MSYLQLSGVTKRFKRETVLERLDLGVEQGERLVVFGPSGSGKTVMLRLIAGLNEPDEGTISIGNRDVTYLAPEDRGIGMAFQNFALYPHMSAFDNIASPLRARGESDSAVRSRVNEVAELLRIGHVLGHLPKALSNGQKQRTSLARALAPKPPLLLLDDPLRNVDAKLRYEMRLELPRVLRQASATVIYVTQDYKEAMALGDRVAVLDSTRISQIGPPSSIYAAPGTPQIARLFGDPTINIIERQFSNGHFELFGRQITSPVNGNGRRLVGIRPEHIAVSMEPGEQTIPMVLDAVTPLNVRAVLLLKAADGSELLASCSEEEAAEFPRGHKDVHVSIDFARLHVFDPASGQRIDPDRTGASGGVAHG